MWSSWNLCRTPSNRSHQFFSNITDFPAAIYWCFTNHNSWHGIFQLSSNVYSSASISVFPFKQQQHSPKKRPQFVTHTGPTTPQMSAIPFVSDLCSVDFQWFQYNSSQNFARFQESSTSMTFGFLVYSKNLRILIFVIASIHFSQ